jgi:hypothetical protein
MANSQVGEVATQGGGVGFELRDPPSALAPCGALIHDVRYSDLADDLVWWAESRVGRRCTPATM